MKAKLRRMSPAEFEVFSAQSAQDYAKDLLKNSDMSMEEALQQARNELTAELPQGTDTPDHSLMMILDAQTREAAGIIWYLYEWTENVKQVFLSDILIYEPHRRKGYASSALEEMEDRAKKDGCVESIIYVWRHNQSGISLYTKAGYVPFREMEEGMYMKKLLIQE